MASAEDDIINDYEEEPAANIQCESEGLADQTPKFSTTERKRRTLSHEIPIPSKFQEQNMDPTVDEGLGTSAVPVTNRELTGATGHMQQSSTACVQRLEITSALASQNVSQLQEDIKTSFIAGGAIGTFDASRATITIVGKQVNNNYQQTAGQTNHQTLTTLGTEDDDDKHFSKKIQESILTNVQYDIRGKRTNLREVVEHPSITYVVIELKEDEIGSQGPNVKDIKEIDLSQLHEGGVRHSLLIGDAGEGKSTASKQYAKFVIKSSITCLKDIKLVLYIPIMDIDTEKTTPFRLLIIKPLGRSPEHQAVGKAWMETNPHKILFIFDGLDQSKFSLKEHYPKTDYESKTEPAKIISNILSGHLYPGAKILTTSRWHTYWTLDSKVKPDRIIALRGFSEDAKLTLFRQLLPSNADFIIDYIKKNVPHLLFVCSTPNILLNAASVFSKSCDPEKTELTNLPETQTEILGLVVVDLLRSENAPRDRPDNFTMDLAKVAYNGISEDKFQFSLKEIGLQESALQYFMSANAKFISYQNILLEKDKRWYFYHQTIQEFFAALYICNVRDNLDTYLDKLFQEKRMENVLLFWCGIIAHKRTFSVVQDRITDVEIPQNDMREILRKKILSTLNNGLITDIKVCKVLQECDSDFVAEVAPSVRGIQIPFQHLEPRDQFVISSLLSKLGQLEIVDLWDLELNPLMLSSIDSINHLKANWKLILAASLLKDHKSDILQALSKAEFYQIQLSCGKDVAKFSLEHIKGRRLRAIYLDGNKNFGCEGLCCLLNFTQGQGVSLSLRNCDLNDRTLKAIADYSEGKEFQFGGIDLEGNTSIGYKGFCSLLNFLQHCSLGELNLKNCDLNDEKLKAFADCSKQEQFQFRGIDLEGNTSIGYKGFCSLLYFLQHCSLGGKLKLKNCDLNDEKLKAFADCSKQEHIQIFGIDLEGNTSIGYKGFCSLLNFLQHCSVCGDLNLKNCDLNDEKLKAFADCPKQEQFSIPKVYIDGNKNFGPEGCNRLVDFLQHTNIWRLLMRDCNLGTEKFKALGDRLKARNVELGYLSLSQEVSNPDKKFLPAICQLFHCVEYRIDLMRWQFDDNDLKILRRELENSRFKTLEVYCYDKSGIFTILRRR